jgi:hypothetical protein
MRSELRGLRDVGSPEYQIPISAHTAIEGRALRATGAPLESVSVTVKKVRGRYDLTFDPVVADARGAFSLRIDGSAAAARLRVAEFVRRSFAAGT